MAGPAVPLPLAAEGVAVEVCEVVNSAWPGFAANPIVGETGSVEVAHRSAARMSNGSSAHMSAAKMHSAEMAATTEMTATTMAATTTVAAATTAR
jgi:hypothetical protein